jgi:alkylhydroperoxidase family enzyme
MTRFEPVDPDTKDPALSRVFDIFRSSGQEVPLLYRLLANSPAMLEAWVGLAWPLRSQPTTSRALRELQIMRVALLTRASFEWFAHWPAAIAAGATAQELEALSDPDASDLFDDREKAALRCTEELIIDGAASEEAVRQLRTFFSDAECIELLLTAAFYSCVSHTLLSLGVEAPDDPDSRPLIAYRSLTAAATET